MVGEVRRDRRQARRPRLRLTAGRARRAALLLAAAALGACAYAADPPGGPPRLTPPRILQVTPESGAVLTEPPGEADIQFDEVISERVGGGLGVGGGGFGGGGAGAGNLASAILLSPAPAKVSVGWHRSRISVKPQGGFLPGRIYRLELLPVIADLRNNRIKQGTTIVFSTGPEIPSAGLRGTVVDWGGGRAAPGALVEADLLPDTLRYLALADSGGSFVLRQVPPGEYLVYGVLDLNANRKRDPREAFDSTRVTLQDTGTVELYAFVHDTLAPRIRTVEYVDSVTFRIVFDRLLDPTQTIDSAEVHVAPAADTTEALAVAGVFMPAVFDSTRKAAAAVRDSLRRAALEDSLRRAGQLDTLRRAGKPDTLRRAAAPPGAAGRPVRPPPLGPLGGGPPGRGGGRDTTRARTDTAAQRLLRQRPAPSDTRIVQVAAPLQPGSRYQVRVNDIRSLTGVAGASQSTLPVPVPKPAARPRADTSRAAAPPDTGAARAAPPAAPPDTGRAPPAADTLRPQRRSDSLPPSPAPAPAPPDSAHPRPPRRT